jgi:hypothetical protein
MGERRWLCSFGTDLPPRFAGQQAGFGPFLPKKKDEEFFAVRWPERFSHQVRPSGTENPVSGRRGRFHVFAVEARIRYPLPSMPLALCVSPLFEIGPEDPARKRTRPAVGAAPARGALGGSVSV